MSSLEEHSLALRLPRPLDAAAQYVHLPIRSARDESVPPTLIVRRGAHEGGARLSGLEGWIVRRFEQVVETSRCFRCLYADVACGRSRVQGGLRAAAWLCRWL